ncbi:MAG: OmpA family protein [Bacteroidota bacterium]|nr:OmpA family protein [Bacteroidota bacterium]
MRKWVLFGVLSLAAMDCLAQVNVEYPGRPRYADGLLALRLGCGPTKYLGEFTDERVGTHFTLGAEYSIIPELSLGLQADFGRTMYLRRERRTMVTAYRYQYDRAPAEVRSTWFSTFTADLAVHFFPRQYFDAYLLLGGGATLFGPDDYEKEQVRVRPKNDHLAAFTVPVGLGAEYFLTRDFSLRAEFRVNFMFSDDFDGFNSNEIRKAYLKEFEQPIADDIPTEAGDLYSVLSLSVAYRLFENKDLDGDRLLNIDEEALGTNPYDADTDGDGLSDYEEVKVYASSPVRKDTDGDGLNDYIEVLKYRTSPTLVDTDGDGLSDAEEVNTYKTNPLTVDTDGDRLSDGEEILAATNPRDIDTDKDNLNDFAEVSVYKTSPTVPDTDGDGLGDYEEVMGYRTDPQRPDTDGDGLTDFEEVAVIRSNPLLADSDGDNLSDGLEIRVTGTNPLSRDTDGDGVPDDIDRCPILAEVYNGSHDEDGCPDDPSGGKRSIASARADHAMAPFPAPQAGMLVRVDTLVIREGGVFTLFGVNFEVDKDILRPESLPILDENARYFFEYPDMEVEIRGHTDSDASEEYNMDLSLRRAKSVKRYLVSKGIDEKRLTVRGFGESCPIASNATEFGKARNRRIEFFIVRLGERGTADRKLMTGEPRLVEPPGEREAP